MSIFIETNSDVKAEVENYLSDKGIEVTFFEPQKFSGQEILRFMLDHGPAIISAVTGLIALFKKRKVNFTIILPSTKRLENPTEEEIKKELSQENLEQNE